jgi:hypothetical protein
MPRRQIPMCRIWMDFFTFLGGYPEDESCDEGLQMSESDGDFTKPNILTTDITQVKIYETWIPSCCYQMQ